ncbi:hypothetical protein SKAU_G00391140 [Synaphobranchus kaupii]|uniref:Uncharacterized protein n=1 Tax=Synaphobranchus kaupii TaxID=118154 RepID=A0A9Q1EBK5_SYNKA|nr:hypothetical protein SKAU_G00391140 [Synaphobranchus kaupii]
MDESCSVEWELVECRSVMSSAWEEHGGIRSAVSVLLCKHQQKKNTERAGQLKGHAQPQIFQFTCQTDKAQDSFRLVRASHRECCG